ncbi:MAG: sugar ABC transporter ATP-binding protein [Parasporobacterium sp.]|nr:sugar ABC transporter ATP-binding protein [Parasporobacterium sp.]
MADIVLKIEHLCKYFGATKANDDLNIEIPRGAVLGLAGENGSGKSTLASMICGIQKPTSGKMYLNGQEYAPKSPVDANAHKVSMVLQELGVVGSMDPVLNMFLGRTKQFAKGGLLNLNAIKKEAEAQFEKWNLTKVPMTGVAGNMSIEQRKVLELARALSIDPKFLILDEISQALSHDNRKVLYDFIKKFTSPENGGTILMVTHDLEEMVEICTHISVLRDGKIIDTRRSEEYEMDELKRLMIGREVSGDYYRADQEEIYSDEVVLRVEHLNVPGELVDINFELHKGEILGVCGLSDGGIHSVGPALFGISEHRTGTVEYVPGKVQLKKPLDMIKTKGAYLSKDRDKDGLMLDASIGQNISVPNVRLLAGAAKFLSPKKVNDLSQKASVDFEIKSSGLGQVVKSLSGGNKQKVNLSRWLVQDLDYVILDCPTRGVDIGVKAYIYGVLKKMKESGIGIILISDELPEAMGMSDRLLVMKDHEMAGMLSRTTDFVEEKIVEVML